MHTASSSVLTDSTAVETTNAGVESATAPAPVVDDVLIEDVSIDGMCGVY